MEIKALILVYEFPPYISVAGQRPNSWFKYFKENNIEPIIITRQWDNSYNNELDYVAPSKSKYTEIENINLGTILKAPYKPNLANKILLKYGNQKFKYLRKIISAYYEFIQFILPIGPKIEIYNSANKFLKYNKVDMILASGDPFVLFHYASKLSKKHEIPWVADYRDPWSHDSSKKNILLKIWSSYYEKKIVNTATCIITVSEFIKAQISELTTKKIYLIPNGYESEFIEQAKKNKQTNKCLSIALAGTIYDWNPIEGFLFTVNEFVKKGNALTINFYGINKTDEINNLISSKFPSIKNHVKIHTKLPYENLLEKLAENNLLLLFNYYSYMGTKIYDYIGLERKILLCFSNDDESKELKKKYYSIKDNKNTSNRLQENLIQKTNSGIVLNDKEDLYRTLLELESEFNETKMINCNTINSEDFSRKGQVKKISNILKNTFEKQSS